LIRTTRPTPHDFAEHRENLLWVLSDLDPKEIASFEKHYLDLADELFDVRVVEVMWVLSGGGGVAGAGRSAAEEAPVNGVQSRNPIGLMETASRGFAPNGGSIPTTLP
jgi:hypothetical protein